MEQKTPSLMNVSLTSAIYIGLAIILVSVVFYVTGNTFSTAAQYFSWPILIGGAVFAQLNYKKALGGTMTYGQALGVGLLAILFATVLSSIYTFLMYSVIDPSLQDQLRLMTEQKMMEKGNMSDAQMEMAVDMAAKFQSPIIMTAMGIFGGAFSGLIISLITSIFTKKNPEGFVE